LKHQVFWPFSLFIIKRFLSINLPFFVHIIFMLRLRHGKRLLQPVNVEEKLHFSNIIGKSYSLGCVRTIFYCILAEKKKSSIVCITNFIFILEKKTREDTFLLLWGNWKCYLNCFCLVGGRRWKRIYFVL
jgi:hypothetical protein